MYVRNLKFLSASLLLFSRIRFFSSFCPAAFGMSLLVTTMQKIINFIPYRHMYACIYIRTTDIYCYIYVYVGLLWIYYCEKILILSLYFYVFDFYIFVPLASTYSWLFDCVLPWHWVLIQILCINWQHL